MKFKLLFLLFIYSSVNVIAQEECSELLKHGIYNVYKYDSEDSFQADLKRILSYSKEELENYKHESQNDLSIGVKDVLSLLYSGEESSESFRKLQEELKINEHLAWKSNSYKEVLLKTLDSKALESWIECLKIYSSVNVMLSVVGDKNRRNGEMIINLSNSPKRKTDGSQKIKNVFIVGASQVASCNLVEGAILNEFTGLSCIIKRDNDSKISIAIDFEDGTTIIDDIPAIKPVKPTSVIMPISKNLEFIGGWKKARVKGKLPDNEMDTDGKDVVPVTSTSELYIKNNQVWIKVSFKCREYGGDGTNFYGDKHEMLYNAKEKKIVRIITTGGVSHSFSGRTKGENHIFNKFSTKGTYWSNMEFRVDSKGKRDDKIVGIRGTVTFKMELRN